MGWNSDSPIHREAFIQILKESGETPSQHFKCHRLNNKFSPLTQGSRSCLSQSREASSFVLLDISEAFDFQKSRNHIGSTFHPSNSHLSYPPTLGVSLNSPFFLTYSVSINKNQCILILAFPIAPKITWIPWIFAQTAMKINRKNAVIVPLLRVFNSQKWNACFR